MVKRAYIYTIPLLYLHILYTMHTLNHKFFC